MNKVLNNIEPSEVFKYFEEISQIPRGSGNEKEISDYLVKFAKDNGLEVIQDEYLNVIIKKPATPGYEKSPTVIIQGHMDMVCEKNEDTEFDFLKDPLKLVVNGDYIEAEGTTLGADDGIAVAMSMALLSSKDIPHPPLQILITTEEEIGLRGASGLKSEDINGDMLINIDSEEEGKLLTSCAGGVRSKVNLPIVWEEASQNLQGYNIKIRGLVGGHSGVEINKQRANANKLLGRILKELKASIYYELVDLKGGSKMNAIPREADCMVLINSKDEHKLLEIIKELQETFKNEYRVTDSNVKVEVEKVQSLNSKTVFSKETLEKIISILYLLPNGIQSMSSEIEGLVESSSNIGVVSINDDKVLIDSASRSSVRSLIKYMKEQITLTGELTGAEVTFTGEYPEWEYRANSPLRDISVKIYKEMFDKELEITAIHAGLECGILKEKIGDIDMISVGPEMHNVHSPDERLSISSTKRTWDFIKEILKNIK